MEIKCPNKRCNESNPLSAKYCRICGTKLNPSYSAILFYRVKDLLVKFFSCNNPSEIGFTLDKFKSISLKPVSTVKIQFFSKFCIVIGCILSAFLILFESCSEIRWFFRNMLGEYNYEALYIFVPFTLIPIAVIGISFLVSSYKKVKFRLNADYLESATFIGDIVRIARRCKLGLFDNKSKRVLLSSNYDIIEKFDGQHIMLKKNGKCGIYSLTRKSIIIPVVFDSISEFRNSVASASSGGNTIHFDIKGNRLR